MIPLLLLACLATTNLLIVVPKMPLLKPQKEIRALANPSKAEFLKRFFKTGPGQYAEGDQLLGVAVPQTRLLVRKFQDIPLTESKQLVRSPLHEERLLGLLIWVRQFKRGTPEVQKKIYQIYLKHTRWINNWDLVDSSARDIVGAYLFERDRKLLNTLARSSSLWERRISIIATHYFIQKNDLADTYRISLKHLDDSHDLMHKATGWMLREAGKKDPDRLRKFLTAYARRMPRTMLRYSIEHFSAAERKRFLNLK